jgi:signal transduction histidine kinase
MRPEGTVVPASETVQSRLLREHRRVLELVARGVPAGRCLEELCLATDHVEPSVRTAILLVSDDGRRFTRIIAPRLRTFAEALRRLPGEDGSTELCAPAVCRDPLSCPDVARDPGWPPAWKSLFLRESIQAVFTAPIGEGPARPLGCVLLGLESSRKPGAWGRALAEMASGLATIILAREQSDEALAASRLALAAELQLARLLQRVSTQLIQTEGIDALYDQILDTAVAIMRSDFASFQVLHPERGELLLLGHRGFPPGSERFWEWVRVTTASTCGMALKTGRRAVVTDVERCELMAGSAELEAHRRAGIRAAQSTPLYSRSGAMLGMISTHWRRPHEPTESEFRALDVLARQAADLIERFQAEEALRVANRRKDEFLATLAHELRNPIAPLRSALEVLKLQSADGGTAAASIAMSIAMMERQLDLITRLVDDLLDLSRVSRGMVSLRREPVDVASLLDEAGEAIHPVAEAANHRLTVTPPADVYVFGDRARLGQVLHNLLNNACKFSDPGGHIELAAAREGDEVVIRVKDSGKGIERQDLPHIFDMFVQGRERARRDGGGLGIGLTLVRNLVGLHGGSVAAESAGPGQGAEFTVRLPVAVAAERPAGGVAADVRTAGNGKSAPRRVLVVDDNRDAADSLSLLLKLQGHEVHTAYDGLEAVAAAEKLTPDVILLDIGLPGLDGYETARRIREQQGLNGSLLVALTGWGQERDRLDAKEAGFDLHLVKPIDAAALNGLLARTSH